MTNTDIHRLHRYTVRDTPIYILADAPYWFVPSSGTDAMLRDILRADTPEEGLQACAGKSGEALESARERWQRLQHLLPWQATPYAGRYALLEKWRLKELWLHITDTCNLACRHCLFSASPAKHLSLAPAQVHALLDEAAALGCRLFFFTGGEPFVHPDFPEILAHAQNLAPDSRTVVLTNGLLLKTFARELASLDQERLFLQVSLDGPREIHDRLRGTGSFDQLAENLLFLRQSGIGLTLSVAVNRDNLAHLDAMAEAACRFGAHGLHLMYHFTRGKGSDERFVSASELVPAIVRLWRTCREKGLVIDNMEALASQVFAPPCTRHDLSNMAWESVAIGPDGNLYPSPALVHVPELACGPAGLGLAHLMEHSPLLQRIRRCSLTDHPDIAARPLSLLTGGGDPDHSWASAQSFTGHDPYLPLYEELMLHLIAEEAEKTADQGLLRLCMGDIRRDCPQDDAPPVVLTHCNCVVALSGKDGHAPVRDFYGAAARQANQDILNPDAPATDQDRFIPTLARQRSYGCGSPVRDAAPSAGETLVDLGSGSGVECFLAAREVGPEGRIIGIDMTQDMLRLAGQSREQVVRELGYDNISFVKGLLEGIPLADNSADVVISNCVINLSPDKRSVFREIFRILKPGGRMVIADIVTDGWVNARLAHSRRWRGECLGGAMRQELLMQMLEDAGFSQIYLHKRSFYREVQENRFFSLTYEARKPLSRKSRDTCRAIYRGPWPALDIGTGLLLRRGFIYSLPARPVTADDPSLFLLNEEGEVTNLVQEPCSCATAPEQTRPPEQTRRAVPIRRHRSGCMVCGRELVYSGEPMDKTCHFCGQREKSNSHCSAGHFICDTCHQQEALEIIRHICVQSPQKDMIALLELIRSHPAVPMHGPEHHAMVPGVILAAYRNSGGALEDRDILAGIERGSKVPGGACGFWGSCGAAVGAGIAAAIILEATPLTPHPRQKAQAFTARILQDIAAITGGRCCQRETWIALCRTAALADEFFGLPMTITARLHCRQYTTNRECIRKQCPLWSDRQRMDTPIVLPLGVAR